MQTWLVCQFCPRVLCRRDLAAYSYICSPGIVKTYKLTYESVEVMHAVFDKASVSNTFTISASVLKDFIEYFEPKAEQLDIYSENGRATFTSYTEKIMEGKGSWCPTLDKLDTAIADYS